MRAWQPSVAAASSTPAAPKAACASAHKLRLATIKKRSDFLLATAGGIKFITPVFILQMQKRAETHPVGTEITRFGFTVTKKIGNAVIRNRVKRRLREAVRKSTGKALAGHDYVIIARNKALACEFSALVRDLEFAFSRIVSMKDKTPKP